MKILIWSDGGAHTGYGTVVENLGRRWHAKGAEVHVLAVNYRGDPWDSPLKLYPATKGNPRDVFGVQRIGELINSIKPDIFFILEDLYAVEVGFKVLKGKFPIPTVLYVPIDGIGLPRSWWPAVKAADMVIAMAEHGQRVIKREAGLDVDVLVHGVEHDLIFSASPKRPLNVTYKGQSYAITSKAQAKELLSLKDRFIILGLNRNSVRKNFYDSFRVFDHFRRKHSDAFFYVHAAQNDEGGDLVQLASRYGLTRKHVWIHSPGDTYLGSDKSALGWIYNAADVKLTTSMAEGFGLTDAEALACGTPVIAQNFSAMADVVGPGGILVPIQRYFTTAKMVDFALPDLGATLNALERLYADPAYRQDLGQKAVAHARRYNWDNTANGFYERFKALVRQRSAPKVITVDSEVNRWKDA